jgi:hypothetical protein
VHEDGVQPVWKFGEAGELVGKQSLNILDLLIESCERKVSMLQGRTLIDGGILTMELSVHALAKMFKLFEELRPDLQI